MKKIYFILFAVFCCNLVLMAEPYGLLINGSTQYVATKHAGNDFQGREQFLVSCVALKQGDKVQLIDFGNNNATWMSAIDPYGEYQKFTKNTDHLICNTAGSYDFYIKMKYQDDMVYIGPGENCDGGTTPTPDTPTTTPDTPTTNPETPNQGNYISSVPSACTDVMLQGFYWDSNQDKTYGNTRWNTLYAMTSEITAYFDLVWLPPSAKSSGGVGYLPAQYSNQTSAWGSRAELEKLITALHNGGTKVIADMVVNHASNQSNWCDFYVQDFGEYGVFYPDASWICKTDEVNTASSGSCKGKATGGADDGYGSEANYGAARDWDHTSEEVREMFRAYAKWMTNVMKYDGFRYDYCKGFHNSHINDYNCAGEAYLAVMEYWDGNANTLWQRIKDANQNTMTFDFATKYTAFNNSMAKGSYSGCKGAGLLGLGKGKYAVTFIDNHDTYQRANGNEYTGDILRANAYLLSMPGVPCVFYPHWKQHKEAINAMILARKSVGVHSESNLSEEGDGSGYRATVTGKNGMLVLELGNKVTDSKSGYTKAASGNGYVIWTQVNSSIAPQLIVSPSSTTYKTESLTIEMRAISGSGTPVIYYTLDETDPKTSATRVQYTAPFSITGTTVVKAYATADGKDSEVATMTYTYKAPQTTPIIVAFAKPDDWAKVNLYSWIMVEGSSKATEYTGGWPGTELTEQNANGMYYYTFDAAITEVNFIFNDGKATGAIQTADLWTDEDVCYGWENGAEKLIDCGEVTTDIEHTEVSVKLDLTQPMYNMLGQEVGAEYRGIVIQNGHKYLK